MMSSQTTTYPGMHVAIPNPYPPTSSMALHPQPPLGFLNTGNQVQTGQLSYITSPGILTTHQLSLENVPTGHPAPGTTTNPKFKDAAMALGAVQIITGLVHIGFGIVLGLLSINYHMAWAFYSVAFIGGYPFWGGLSFIASGSLSVSAFKKSSPLCPMAPWFCWVTRHSGKTKEETSNQNPPTCPVNNKVPVFMATSQLCLLFYFSLLKSTLATNIISVIFASVGVILFVWDLNINGYYYQNYWMVLSGKGIVGVLAIFSMLEVSIACVMVYFAYQTLLHGKRSALAVPTVHVANPLTQQPFPDPAIYERVPAYAPQP